MNRIPQLVSSVLIAMAVSSCAWVSNTPAERPNVLFAISDDQSYPHASAYGARFVSTPAFDRIAEEGILFHQAFVASPGCAPSRASMVTGRYPWENRHAGNHNTFFPSDIVTLPELLRDAGYHVGFTGKGVGPFHWGLSGRQENPAGPEYNEKRNSPPEPHISHIDYAANFEAFLADRPDGEPFFFWYGASEPHRTYAYGAGLRADKKFADVDVPPYLPDADSIRFDMLDYAVEIEWFDRHLQRMVSTLEEIGSLDNTVVIVTGDNGMPFPAAKANVYDAGFHVPLAIRWGSRVEGGRESAQLVSLMDLTPTVLDLAGVGTSEPVSGHSWRPLLLGGEGAGYDRTVVFSARERHSSSRWGNLGYPQRAARTTDYLYIRNYHPERWPAGAPEELGPKGDVMEGYHDLDWSEDTGLSSRFVIRNADDPAIGLYAQHALGLRPAEELYDIRKDPGCMTNLVNREEMQDVLVRMRTLLEEEQRKTGDPRIVGPNPDEFESHPRLAAIRHFPWPEWADAMEEDEVYAMEEFSGSDYSPLVQPDSVWEGGLATSWWILEEDASGEWRLFDRRSDPGRQNDLRARMPQVVSQLARVHREATSGYGVYDR